MKDQTKNRIAFSQIAIGAISGVLSSVLITCAALSWQLFYIPRTELQSDNLFLHRLYLSTSDKYIQSKIGIPFISNYSSPYVENYYLLNDVILKTVSKNGTVVAYFITSYNTRRKIPFNLAGDEITIGNYKYSDIPLTQPTIEAYFSGNYRGCYYIEKYGTGRAGMYNTYVCASLSYGFLNDKSRKLMEMNNPETLIVYTEEEKENARKEAMPNTFGVINPDYTDKLSVFLTDDALDQFHALENATIF